MNVTLCEPSNAIKFERPGISFDYWRIYANLHDFVIDLDLTLDVLAPNCSQSYKRHWPRLHRI